MESSSFKFSAIRDTLAEADNVLTTSELCAIAGVSRTGYYTWLRAEETRQKREEQDQADFRQILTAYRFRGYDKGVRGIHMRLLHTGVRMNVKKIRRLMRKYGLFCPIRKANPYRRMQRAIRTNNTAEDLVKREFEEHGPRSILLTDITYIPMNGTFCYLSTILDACTKQVLSHVLSESLEVDFVLDTVEQLVERHGVSLNKETIIHSDQGCHYTCIKFIHLVKNSDLRQSMSRKGNCWDNAPQESFFGHMKDELASEIPKWTCFEDVRRSIDDWIDYYNNDRCQWDLAKLSPNEYYQYLTTGEYPCLA
ncbi:MAG: IS3 family transposase [Oscillospiraceae bacterium]|nr:IS3 family transposase [Oscillospiraceae bacterium]